MTAYATQCVAFRKANLAPWLGLRVLLSTGSAICLIAMFRLEGLDHAALAVRDVERSAKWYVDVLGFERRHEGMWKGIPVFIGLGQTALALFPAKIADAKSLADRAAVRILHLALRANRENFLAAQRDLTSRGIAFQFEDHEISHSIYFRDPDGHQLEITTYDLE